MTVSHGQDAERVEAVGTALLALAERVETVRQTGQSGVAVLLENWDGPDVRVFEQDWQGAVGALGEAAGRLRETSRLAHEQAAAQRDASDGGGAGPGGPGGAGAAPTRTTPDPTSGPLPSAEDLPIPIPDDGRPWTPQGLGYSEEHDAFVYTMYDHDNPGDGLLVIQPADGGPVQYVPIAGNDHYGGVAVQGDDVYVSGNGEAGVDDGSRVQRYSLEQLMAAGGTDTGADPVDPVESVRVPTGSTLTVDGDSLYLAEYANRGDDGYEPGTVYQYRLGPDGELPPVDPATPAPPSQLLPTPVSTFEAPGNMQGLVAHDGAFYFTQSRGPDDPSNLVRVDPATGEQTVVRDDLSSLSQGLVVRDGQLVITSESGAEPYRGDVEDSDNPFLPNGLEHPVEPEDTLQERDIPD